MIGTLSIPWTTMAFYRMPDQTFDDTMRETDDDFPQGPYPRERQINNGSAPVIGLGGGAIGSIFTPPIDHYAAREGKEVPCIVYAPAGNKYGGTFTPTQVDAINTPFPQVRAATFAFSYKTVHLDPTDQYLGSEDESGLPVVRGGPTRDTGISALIIILGGPPNGAGLTDPITITPGEAYTGNSTIIFGAGGVGGQGFADYALGGIVGVDAGGGGGGAGFNTYNWGQPRDKGGVVYHEPPQGMNGNYDPEFNNPYGNDDPDFLMEATGVGWEGARGGPPGHWGRLRNSANGNWGQSGLKFLEPGTLDPTDLADGSPSTGGVGATGLVPKFDNPVLVENPSEIPFGGHEAQVLDFQLSEDGSDQIGSAGMALGYCDHYAEDLDFSAMGYVPASFNKIHLAPEKTYIVNNGLIGGGGAGGGGGFGESVAAHPAPYTNRKFNWGDGGGQPWLPGIDYVDQGFGGGETAGLDLDPAKAEPNGRDGLSWRGEFIENDSLGDGSAVGNRHAILTGAQLFAKAGPAVRMGDKGAHGPEAVVFLSGGPTLTDAAHGAKLDGAKRCFGVIADSDVLFGGD